VRIATQGCARIVYRPPQITRHFAAITRGSRGALVALEHGRRFAMIRVSLSLSSLFVFTAISASGGEPLRIAASPRQSFEPSNLTVRARVIPDAGNRALEIVAEAEDFYRSSQIELDGNHSPAMVVFEFHDLPGGNYLVYGVLTDASGQRRAISQQDVRVLSRFGAR
jgi:hypothetical protein